MKKHSLFIRLFFVLGIILLSSCNNDVDTLNAINGETSNDDADFEIVKISSSKLKSLGNDNVTEDEYVLKFKNETAFEKTLASLNEMSQEDRLNWSEQLDGFTSIAQKYEKAMEEAEE